MSLFKLCYLLCYSMLLMPFYCLCQPFCILRALPEVIQFYRNGLLAHAIGLHLLPTLRLTPASFHLAYLSCGDILDITCAFTCLRLPSYLSTYSYLVILWMHLGYYNHLMIIFCYCYPCNSVLFLTHYR